MTRNVHDQFAKEWMQELLVDFGEVEIEFQVGTEIRKIDVYFKPNPIADPSPKVLGSFGKMLMTPALLEHRQQTIEHLARLQMTLQARQNESRLFREVAMNLSPVYDEWREKTLAEGREQGISQGISLGREQGISLGREQGQMGLLKQQLVVKFTPVPDRILAQVDRLSSEKLTELAIGLLSFERVADLERWLAEHGME